MPLTAHVIRASDRDFSVRFDSTLKARIALVRHIYSGIHERSIREVRFAPIAKAVFSRLMK